MFSYTAIDEIPVVLIYHFFGTNSVTSWDFVFVVSDCGAIENLYHTHHVTSSYEETVGLALHDGVVLDCGDTVQSHGMRSISDGYLMLNDVERALRNLFCVLHALGYFDESAEGLPVVDETQT